MAMFRWPRIVCGGMRTEDDAGLNVHLLKSGLKGLFRRQRSKHIGHRKTKGVVETHRDFLALESASPASVQQVTISREQRGTANAPKRNRQIGVDIN